jgi:2-polyprenyl-3-methyl-5-hydroxy-6-metoxy-1,4-benzoquinol methylase
VFKEFDADILQCRSCRHISSSHQLDPQYAGYWDENVVVADPYWSVSRMPMYEDFVGRFMAGRSGSVIDMGCGLGFFVQYATRFPGWEAHGCEISPAAVRYAREKLGLTKIHCGRLDEVKLPEQSFDIVTMWDVLDHLLEPDAILQKCRSLIKPNGFCFIRTPNIRVQLPRARINKVFRGMREGVTYLQATHHPHHYSTDTIRMLLNRNGFSRVEFVHFRPVLAAPGASWLSRSIKSSSFWLVRALAAVSGGRVNLDNLYVIARP